MTERHTSAFSRRDVRPSHVRIALEREEGAGNAGCFSHTHSLMCGCKKHTSKFTTGQPLHRHSLRNGFNGLSARSPRRPGLLAAVVCEIVSRRLDPSVGGSGPHALAVRQLHRSSGNTARVHRIPPRVRDDAYAPPVEAGCAEKCHDFPKNGRDLFFARRLDTNSENQPVGQIRFV
jgi:hypothetical protein